VKDNELFAQEKVRMIKAHLAYVSFYILRTLESRHPVNDKQLQKHLLLLTKIHALDVLIKEGAAAFDAGYFAKGALGHLTTALDQLLVQLRPQLLSLTEAMYIPDHKHPSAIGNEYGDIYE
jgi:hypothetical protein